MTTKKTKPNPMQVIAAAKLPETSVELCLRGDLVAQLATLERQLEAEQGRGDQRLTGNQEAKKLAQQIDKLQRDMQDSTVAFTFRALPSSEFLSFLAKHPPRDGDATDQSLGFNRDTYFADLTRRCLIDPDLDDEQWQKLQDALTARQWNQLTGAANALNIDDVDVPFSAAASQLLQPFDEQ